MNAGCLAKAWIVYPENSAVTSFYLDIVSASFRMAGYDCEGLAFGNLNKNLKKRVTSSDVLVVDSCTTFLKAYLLGFRNIVLWCQGILPEESYMRNRSKARRMVLSHIEKFALKKAILVVLVSREMQDHYEEKYGYSLEGKSYIMPCFNARLRHDAFEDKKKYRAMKFTYVGSLAPWQCFDETLLLYKEIEKECKDASLSIYTFEQNEARRRALDCGITRFEVKTLPPDLLGDELRTMSYGFMIREDTEVNRVATPTKLSSYLSCGVIPIYSDCLVDFANATDGLSCVCPIGEDGRVANIVDFICSDKDVALVKAECQSIFNGYYSERLHRDQLAAKIRSILPQGGQFGNAN